MKRLIDKIQRHERRKARVRRRVTGTSERPRLTVFRSNKNIYAQIIDDLAARTIVAASTQDKNAGVDRGSNKAAAAVVGVRLAEKAMQAGVKQVVFDRNGYAYHGRIKELADAARKAGLQF